MKSRKAYVLVSTVVCALAMSFVDGVIQPPYGLKSVLKIILFLCIPLGYFGLFRAWDSLKALFVLKRRELLLALALGIGAFGVITGGVYADFQVFQPGWGHSDHDSRWRRQS